MEDKNKNKVQPKIKSGRTNDDHTYKRTYSLDIKLSPYEKELIENKYDQAGEEINYEIKEEVFDGLTGDAKTGYMDSYETNETTDADGTTTKNIIITNTHTPETTQKKVKKILYMKL